MPKKTSSSRRGFTLIELMVVIGVMGALIAIAAGNFVSAQVKARDARRKSDLTQISKALELYYNDHGQYPLAAGNLIGGCGSDSEQPCVPSQGFEDEHGTLYMDTIPEERTTGMYYVYRSNGLAYQLFARLENENDPVLDRNNSGVYDATDDYDTSCGAADCNFAVTSPNISGDDPL